MKTLTNEKLNEICRRFAQENSKIDIYHKMSLRLMLETGCRISEAVNSSLWKMWKTDLVVLKTIKDNHVRVFDKSDLSDFTYTAIRTGLDWSIKKSKYPIYSSCRQYFGDTVFLCGKKEILFHLFRHNYIKHKHMAGLSIETLKNLMGHKDVKNTEMYINSEIIMTQLPY